MGGVATVDLEALKAELEGIGRTVRIETYKTVAWLKVTYGWATGRQIHVDDNGQVIHDGLVDWEALDIVRAAIGIRLVPHLAGDAARTEEGG